MERNKKKARKIGAIIVFLDEVGLLMGPLLKRTWAPIGSTPQIELSMGGGKRKVSMIGALAVDVRRPYNLEFLFQVLKNENVDATRFRSFLQALVLTLECKIILVVDNLKAHHARIITEFVRENSRQVSIEYLPAYAPELNPVEYVWTEVKFHELSNYAPHTVDELEKKAIEAGMRVGMKRRTLRSCVEHCQLPIWRN